MSRLARSGSAIVAAIAVVALVGVLVAAAVDRRDLAFSPGVPIIGVAAQLGLGETACQRGVQVPAAFRAIQLTPRGLGGPGPAFSLDVVDPVTDRTIRHANVPGGYPDGRPLVVGVARVPAGRRIDVCVLDRGEVNLGLDGGKAESAPTSPLFVEERRSESTTLALEFLRGEPRSVLSQVPLIFRRAALFRPGWVGAWTFWALAALVGIGVPMLLARAVGGLGGDAQSR